MTSSGSMAPGSNTDHKNCEKHFHGGHSRRAGGLARIGQAKGVPFSSILLRTMCVPPGAGGDKSHAPRCWRENQRGKNRLPLPQVPPSTKMRSRSREIVTCSWSQKPLDSLQTLPEKSALPQGVPWLSHRHQGFVQYGHRGIVGTVQFRRRITAAESPSVSSPCGYSDTCSQA